MSSLFVSVGISVKETQNFSLLNQDFFVSELLNISFNRIITTRRRSNGVLLNGGFRASKARKLSVLAKAGKTKHEYPWPDNFDPDIKNTLPYLSHFKPLPEKPKQVTLGFEKPLVDLDQQINEVRKMADETGLDFSDQISLLEKKYQQALKELYKHLTPIQRLSIARHPNRPTVLDHVLSITDKWVELHGDRAGYDDPAIVTGIGSMDGKSYMFIGHQKGRNTKENISRNFGMPTPHGYRKALRMMKYADHHGLPIITFIDTPGAFADLKSEELGQGEAIAYNLRAMFGFKVPIVAVVTGEGGSGGALAIGCANKLFMLENSAFYCASPEACAAILWKSSQAAPKAAEKLRITAEEHVRLGIADGIIPEPLGGAHTDPEWTSQQIKLTIKKTMEELGRMDTEELLHHRMMKFRKIGGIQEGGIVDPERKRNMKPSDRDNSSMYSGMESEIENLKKKILETKGSSDPMTIEAIEKLKKDVDQEMTNAFISMGLQEKLLNLKMELSKESDNATNQPLNGALKEKVEKLMREFNHNLSQPGAYPELKQKLKKLNMVNNLVKKKEKGEQLKKDINQKAEVNAIMETLKHAKQRIEKGEAVDKNLSDEVERAKEELQNVLKSANLEIIGMGTRKKPSTDPNSEEKVLMEVNKGIGEAIVKAANVAGLRDKIEELKKETAKNSSSARVKELETEIKEGIASSMDVSTLKEQVENFRVEAIKKMEKGAENGRS
ncbi:hypothetical protein MKW98_011091 [Papaver atlanticum]|uniref:acetyl-CoA carboxytransferase n=1 Tax=Papaver atlanticum TaxID=357466 RepID=A0AAD4XX19_9MAGN|nr:hypothetical protein MKW98_011091 [Papaver atlanticum]